MMPARELFLGLDGDGGNMNQVLQEPPTLASDAVVAVLDTHEAAEAAVRSILESGLEVEKVSLIGRGYHSTEHPLGFFTTADRMKSWGALGALWGSLWGLLLGAGFLILPGIGAVAVAGPLAATLGGALEGAVVGGGVSALGAALASLGLPQHRIVKFEAALEADQFLIVIHGSASDIAVARAALGAAAAPGDGSQMSSGAISGGLG
jgi:hypothetical protein